MTAVNALQRATQWIQKQGLVNRSVGRRISFKPHRKDVTFKIVLRWGTSSFANIASSLKKRDFISKIHYSRFHSSYSMSLNIKSRNFPCFISLVISNSIYLETRYDLINGLLTASVANNKSSICISITIVSSQPLCKTLKV